MGCVCVRVEADPESEGPKCAGREWIHQDQLAFRGWNKRRAEDCVVRMAGRSRQEEWRASGAKRFQPCAPTSNITGPPGASRVIRLTPSEGGRDSQPARPASWSSKGVRAPRPCEGIMGVGEDEVSEQHTTTSDALPFPTRCGRPTDVEQDDGRQEHILLPICPADLGSIQDVMAWHCKHPDAVQPDKSERLAAGDGEARGGVKTDAGRRCSRGLARCLWGQGGG